VLSGLSLAVFYPGNDKWDALILLALYSVNRLFLFDMVYNKARGLYLDYIGNTGYWDMIVSRILKKIKMPYSFWLFIKFVIWLTVSGTIMYNYKF
jgi:hypothetical protein